jgi:hypothetical protein
MPGIETFWKPRLAGAKPTAASQRPGWLSAVSAIPGFVEPNLSVVEGNPEKARLLIIAAPGAVGKSSYASAVAAATNSVLVDLAKTDPLGGNFFTGGLSRAFGLEAPTAAARGEIGLVVDALDEAQMRAGPEGFEAGLLDLAEIAKAPTALPIVLLGRGLAAEDAYLLLSTNGFEACLLTVEFFTDEQAAQYLRTKLPLVAKRSDRKVESAFRDHGDRFRELAELARTKLIEVAGCDQTRFAGYAPVLDAICEFTLESDGLNPQLKIANLKATNQIELIDDITTSILERERGKLRDQFRERHPEATAQALDRLYTLEDQLQLVASNLFGLNEPPLPELPKEIYYTTYKEMVDQFGPQHPFVSANGVASNPVFAAYVVAWALRKSGQAELVRKAVVAKPNVMSGIFFDLYQREMESEKDPVMPLADVGILYQALNSQVLPGQRVQLEISDHDGGIGSPIDVNFEILERVDPKTGDSPPGRCLGPFRTTSETFLELHSPFSNVFVDADVTVELGDGVVQQIGAPTELSVEALIISAKQVLINSGGQGTPKELQTVRLHAREAVCDGIQNILRRDEVALSVSWPGAKAHPWTPYLVEVSPPADDGVAFMRRRLRRILTAFRSHSKGALVRLAAKIDHNRMTQDERGVALVRALVDDKILELFDAQKFYRLDQDEMARKLRVSYHDLALSRFTPECDSYLISVLSRIKAGR